MKLQRWPGYHETKPRTRQLALLDAGQLLLPEKSVPVNSWEDIKRAAFSCDPLPEIFVTDLQQQPWWQEALQDPACRVMVPATAMLHSWSMVQCLYVKKGRKRVWIISSRVWHTPVATPAFLAQLQALFALCGVGARPTPGSLGQALMRQTWQQEHRRWVSRPTNLARLDLLAHSLGGRVDYWVTPKERFAAVYEQDVSGAYGSVCDRLPGGDLMTLHAEPGAECVSWFMACRVIIPADSAVAVGIFGEKALGGHNEYPTTPGNYDLWLWKEEADCARQNGWIVLPRSGWGWTRWNTGLAGWAQTMYQLRLAGEAIDSQLGQWMKLAMVAALGRFGMPVWNWKVLPETSPEATDGDLALLDEGSETGYLLHRVVDWASNHLTHWYSFILMRARLVLRTRVIWEQSRGNTVLATNFDSLYCLLPADPVTLGKGLGQWKQTLLTKARFPYPRGIVSEQKTTLPGVKHTSPAPASGGVAGFIHMGWSWFCRTGAKAPSTCAS